MATTPGTGPDAEPLFRGYSGRLLLTVSITYLAIQLGRNILPPLLPAIMADLAIDSFRAGIAITLVTVAYAIAMYPGGHLSDQLSRKSVLVAAGTVTILGFGLLTVTTTYVMFLAAAVTLGLGAGLYWIALRALLADLYVRRRGQAFGIQDALGFVGPILAAGAAIVILAVAPWQAGFAPIIVVLLASILLTHRWLDEAYAIGGIELDVRATGRRVFGDAHVRRLLVAYTCGIFAMQAIIGFLPVFLQVEHGFSGTASSVGFGVLFFGAVLTMPISGFLGDRFAYLPVAVAGVLLSVAGVLVFVLGEGRVVILVGVLAFGVGIWAFPPVIQSHLFTHLPTKTMAGDYGAFKTVYAGLGGLGPAYVGYVAGVWSYASAFLSLVGVLVVSVVIFATGHRESAVK